LSSVICLNMFLIALHFTVVYTFFNFGLIFYQWRTIWRKLKPAKLDFFSKNKFRRKWVPAKMSSFKKKCALVCTPGLNHSNFDCQIELVVGNRRAQTSQPSQHVWSAALITSDSSRWLFFISQKNIKLTSTFNRNNFWNRPSRHTWFFWFLLGFQKNYFLHTSHRRC